MISPNLRKTVDQISSSVAHALAAQIEAESKAEKAPLEKLLAGLQTRSNMRRTIALESLKVIRGRADMAPAMGMVENDDTAADISFKAVAAAVRDAENLLRELTRLEEADEARVMQQYAQEQAKREKAVQDRENHTATAPQARVSAMPSPTPDGSN